MTKASMRQSLNWSAAFGLVLCGGAPTMAQVIREAAGSSAASITAAVDAFRSDLGALNPNNPGSVGSGRREINWDGVPDSASSPNAFPGDFFNGTTPGRARGALFSTPGSRLLVSADNSNPTTTPTLFAELNPGYSNEFEVFSPQRLFAADGSTITDMLFRVPGSATPAISTGFGAIFTDVDLAGSTRLEFYDAADQLLLTQAVPAAGIGSKTFSFLGVSFAAAQVGRVRIISGSDALGATDNPSLGVDAVAMDDFIYGEPVAVPEPAALGMLAIGALLTLRRRM